MKSIYLLVIIFITNVFSSQINAQIISVSDTFFVNSINLYKISSLNIIPFSEKIFINDKLINENNYKISYEKGIFSFNDNIQINNSDKIIITYKGLKINIQKEYKRRNIDVVYDTLGRDSVRIYKPLKNILSPESIFGKNIQKSGVIIRGFTIGTNRDFTLNSGLKLQLSGKLSDNIELIAALTDENTPIQPEGNTETLQELDKVFIEIRHNNVKGTFGDFDLIEKKSEFTQLSKKLQGLKGEFNYKKSSSTFVIASSRGKFNSIQFFGEDGKQGPYRLMGVNNERAIIIIAGSEKVYVNGELMKRGENNDYTIDYSNAEITFTPKRLITSFSRIYVDFEYTEQNYQRVYFGTNLISHAFDDKLNFGISYYREGDDESSPINLLLSNDDLKILKDAGDNRFAASRTGVTLANNDTLKLKGYYTKIDTVINSSKFSYYLYLPGKESSIYNVKFSYVGEGKGDYIKESLGNYKFVGIGKGNYLPIYFIPLPELKQIGNVFINTELINGIKINAEFSGSSWDKNLLSTIDDDDNFGYARKLYMEIEPKKINFGDISIGKLGLNFKDRFIQNRFTSLDRINPVEFNRYYNLSNDLHDNQTLREIGITYLPFDQLSLYSSYGYLREGESFSSDRFFNELKLNKESNYNFYYKIDYVKSNSAGLFTRWNRQNSSNYYSFGIVKPGLEFQFENKEDKTNDSLLASSYKYFEIIPYVEFNSFGIYLKISRSFRNEYFPLNNNLMKQSKVNLTQIQLDFSNWKEFSTSLSLTFRKKYYTNEFIKLGFVDNETILLLSQSRFNFWKKLISGDFYYQAASEQSAKLEKVFYKVPKGSGNYIYLGDLNNNGIAEENEFQLTNYDGEFILITVPTEQLFPVIDLKSYLRLSINPGNKIKGNNIFAFFLKNLFLESFYRIDENNKTIKIRDIYLLKLSKFLNDSTTISGTQFFQQDFTFFKNRTDFSFRLRFLERKSLNHYSGGLEKGYFKERSLRIRFRLVKEINNQTDYVNQVDNFISETVSNRNRKINRSELSTDFSYRPVNKLEFGFKILAGRSKDIYPVTPSIVEVNSILIRINYSLANIGRIRLEAERIELNSKSSITDIPFEITKGNVIGKNYFFRVYFDYRIGTNVQTSLSYNARLYGHNKIIHTLNAEARAFF